MKCVQNDLENVRLIEMLKELTLKRIINGKIMSPPKSLPSIQRPCGIHSEKRSEH